MPCSTVMPTVVGITLDHGTVFPTVVLDHGTVPRPWSWITVPHGAVATFQHASNGVAYAAQSVAKLPPIIDLTLCEYMNTATHARSVA